MKFYKCDQPVCEKDGSVIVAVQAENDFEYDEAGAYEWHFSCFEHVTDAKESLKGKSGGEEWIYVAPIIKAWHHIPDEEMQVMPNYDLDPDADKRARPKDKVPAMTARGPAPVQADSKKPPYDLRTKEGRDWLKTDEGKAYLAEKQKS